MSALFAYEAVATEPLILLVPPILATAKPLADIGKVITAVLLLLALGVFHFTDKKIYLVKGILGIAVAITGGFLMGVGWFAYEDNKAEFAKIAIAAGIFICLAGSSSATLSLQAGMPK